MTVMPKPEIPRVAVVSAMSAVRLAPGTLAISRWCATEIAPGSADHRRRARLLP